ncbi:hypothetical protein OAN33_07185, partial [Flavobacteriales bacterium]|nr:hypothetical protein [Flavobacteriales bacterium]
LLYFVFSLNIGFSAVKKRLKVNTQSKSFKEKLIDIETISQGLISEEMFYSIPVREFDQDPIVQFIISDSLIYVVEKCRFNVWEWKGKTWVNLYKKNNKGWCIPNYYFHKDKLIGFTGAGFWTSESEVYSFNSSAGSWEILETENIAPSFYSAADFMLGKDSIISFRSFKLEKGEVKNRDSYSKGYGFSLKSKKWFLVESHFDLNIFSSHAALEIIDMKNTTHLFYNGFDIILHKKRKNFYSVSIKKLPKFDFYYNNGSSVTIIIDGEVIIIKDEIPNNANFEGTISFAEIESRNPAKMGDNLLLILSWVLTGILSLTLGGYWLKKFQKKNVQRLKRDSISLISIILESAGQLINSNEFDVLIEIDKDPNPDSRRVKRSRIINDLNTEYMKLEGKTLIKREKDPKDKRYTLYHIEK